jgi:GTP-binding protein
MFSRLSQQTRKLVLRSHVRSFATTVRNDLRNVAIVAHVDHGKTTLMDALLRQCDHMGKSSTTENIERVMDSNTIERERGITILSKSTSLQYEGTQLNIIDTPGHSDFGGEVERIMSMVDGLLLVIDINEGPMPQTNYILSKAKSHGITPLLCFNKVDRADFDTLMSTRHDDAMMETMEALDNAGYSGEDIDQCMERVLYASAKSGFATDTLEKIVDQEFLANANMKPLLDSVVAHISGPAIDDDPAAPFKMLAALIDQDAFFGRFLIGRIMSGKIKQGATVKSLDPHTSAERERFQVQRIFGRDGMKKIAIEEAVAGDIIGIPNDSSTRIFDTVCDLKCNDALAATAIDRPTLGIRVMSNTGPMRGKEGSIVLMADIAKRLEKEASVNVSIEIEALEDGSYEIRGRGELSLAVVLENMRREDMEFCIAAPRVLNREGLVDENEREVILKKDETPDPSLKQAMLEPYESVTIIIPKEDCRAVLEYFDSHGGEMKDYNPDFSKTDAKMTYVIPTRGLLGYDREFKMTTKGLGRMYRTFSNFGTVNDLVQSEVRTCLVATSGGKATADSLHKLEPRCKGQMFVKPGDEIYEGMIIGESNKHVDITCNPCKTKEVTNIRTTRADEHYALRPARELALEDVLCELQRDELCEVTPKSLRLRKSELREKARLSAKRRGIELSA